MNREDIIRMAQEAGEAEGMAEFVFHPVIERFAALVASAERERIKQANAPEIERINAHIKELEDAVKAEREACAKLCEDSWMAFSRTPNRRLDITPFPELEYVAKVIRARGQE